MTKIKLNLDNLNPLQVTQLATTIKTAMTGNADFATASSVRSAMFIGTELQHRLKLRRSGMKS